PELAIIGAHDPAWQVRRAAVATLADDALLDRLTSDAAPEVATEAAIRLAARRGRDAMTTSMLERIIASPSASPGVVRAVLAWLLAR
nr:hypothetical protein [Deltaproteobacteria bacterium]